LIDALNKEELNPDNKEISDKVDRLLDSEIRKFHSDCVNQNLKKWDQLRAKMSNNKVKNKLNNSVINKLYSHNFFKFQLLNCLHKYDELG